jgi:hypothetical protein
MQKKIIGWKEWCYLPELGLPAIKAKIDTGAKTSSLHAFNIEPYIHNDIDMVRFKLHPLQYRKDVVYEVNAAIIDKRLISDSGAHKELRYIIKTSLYVGKEALIGCDSKVKIIEISLTNRINMSFRMLIGREALASDFIVDSGASFVLGNISKSTIRTMYNL